MGVRISYCLVLACLKVQPVRYSCRSVSLDIKGCADWRSLHWCTWGWHPTRIWFATHLWHGFSIGRRWKPTHRRFCSPSGSTTTLDYAIKSKMDDNSDVLINAPELGNESCRLFGMLSSPPIPYLISPGPFALGVQALMGVIVLGALVFKRYREPYRRPWKIWYAFPTYLFAISLS